MKRLIIQAVCAGIFTAATLTAAAQQVALHNPAAVAGGLVEVDYAALAAQWQPLTKGSFKVINTASGQEVAYQVLTEGTGAPVKILLDVALPAGAKATVKFVEGTPAPVAAKTYGRYVPERKEDFAWENDRVAFRMYGRALEATPKEMAYGVDFWNKRTGQLVINKWYKRSNYHKDEGEGLDYYHVGLTLGAGGIAPYLEDSIWFSRNYTGHRMLDSGPLRTTFELSYDAWQVGRKSVTVTKRVSLDAHAQLSKMDIRYSESLPVAIGISKRKEPGAMLLEETGGVMGYWEPQHGADGTTGIGCIVLAPVKEMKVEKGHLLAVAATGEGNAITYYTGGAWDKAGKIKNAGEWFRYLQEQAIRLRQPVVVKIIEKSKK